MAEKGFGVKEVNLIGASGTPTITSPNNLNLNANNVAISTNVSIGGTLSVTGNVSVGGTLTYEDVTNIDSVGIITARSDVIVGRGLTVTGISTFSGDVHFSLHGAGNPKIQFDESSDLLWFKKQTTGGSSTKLGLGGGTSYDHLQLQQTYTGGGQSEITAYNSNILISAISAEKNITIQSTNDITLANGVYPFIKCEENSSSDQSITLYYGQTGSTPYANPKLQTTSTGVNVTGAITVNGSALSITPTDSDIQVAYTVTANGSSAYRFAGNGVVSTADNPDLYFIRGKKYRFINNSGGSHPFQIRVSDGGSAYSTGVTNNGASSGNIDFAPTFDSPSKLVYQCTSHGGMVGNIYITGGSSDIKMADQWRRTATLNTNNAENFITTDWNRVSGGGLGTFVDNGGMTESGGIFTFPHTGIYLVTWQAYAETSSTSGVNAVNIYVTTDNSSYNNRASSVFSMEYDMSGYNYGNGLANAMIDVTDTSQVKVKFRVYSSGSVAWDVSSSQNRNCATFLRIGDT